MSSEAKLSYTTKVKGTDLLTARGDTEAEFTASYEAMLRIKARIEGGTPTVEQAVETVKEVIPGTTEVTTTTQGETRTDRFDNEYESGAPGTGSCAHGPRILAKRISREGKPYQRYECINNTPFRVGKFDSNAICKHEYPEKSAA